MSYATLSSINSSIVMGAFISVALLTCFLEDFFIPFHFFYRFFIIPDNNRTCSSKRNKTVSTKFRSFLQDKFKFITFWKSLSNRYLYRQLCGPFKPAVNDCMNFIWTNILQYTNSSLSIRMIANDLIIFF